MSRPPAFPLHPDEVVVMIAPPMQAASGWAVRLWGGGRRESYVARSRTGALAVADHLLKGEDPPRNYASVQDPAP